MKRSWRVSAVGIAVIALVAVACGSTLPQAQQGIAQVAGDEFGDVGGETVPPGSYINEKGQVVSAEGEVLGSAEDFGISSGSGGIGSTTEGVNSSASSTGGSSRANAVSGTNGPGVTADTITLGLFVWGSPEQQRAGERATGTNVVGGFDYERGWEALVDYQNAHGGIAGRRIIPVFWTWDTGSSAEAQQEQEECAQWTQDHQVFAGLTWVRTTNILECLHEAGAVVHSFNSVQDLSISPLYRQYPYFVEPLLLSQDQSTAATVEGLYDMDYFAGDIKLGVVTFDHPSFRYAVDNGLVPALRRHGISLAETAYISRGAMQQSAADANNAVLRFKSEGITHVIFAATSRAPWLFTAAAARQDYRPRYGLNSLSAPQAVADLLGPDAQSQFHDALSVGWLPALDTRPPDDPDQDNPTRVLCYSIMRKAGVDYNSPNGQIGALSQCDGLWSLAAGLKGASVINQSVYLAGMNSLRGGYSPAFTWSTFIGPQKHYGIGAVANLHFVDDCACFKYLSRPYAIR